MSHLVSSLYNESVCLEFIVDMKHKSRAHYGVHFMEQKTVIKVTTDLKLRERRL